MSVQHEPISQVEQSVRAMLLDLCEEHGWTFRLGSLQLVDCGTTEVRFELLVPAENHIVATAKFGFSEWEAMQATRDWDELYKRVRLVVTQALLARDEAT